MKKKKQNKILSTIKKMFIALTKEYGLFKAGKIKGPIPKPNCKTVGAFGKSSRFLKNKAMYYAQYSKDTAPKKRNPADLRIDKNARRNERKAISEHVYALNILPVEEKEFLFLKGPKTGGTRTFVMRKRFKTEQQIHKREKRKRN